MNFQVYFDNWVSLLLSNVRYVQRYSLKVGMVFDNCHGWYFSIVDTYTINIASQKNNKLSSSHWNRRIFNAVLFKINLFQDDSGFKANIILNAINITNIDMEVVPFSFCRMFCMNFIAANICKNLRFFSRDVLATKSSTCWYYMLQWNGREFIC